MFFRDKMKGVPKQSSTNAENIKPLFEEIQEATSPVQLTYMSDEKKTEAQRKL